MTGFAGVTVAWIPPIVKSREPIFTCGVCGSEGLAKKIANKPTARLRTIEKLVLNHESFEAYLCC
jgi:hypothetical protein